MGEFPDGMRVRVWNGDRSEYLGEGTYVGDVTVYLALAEGAIVSGANPEVPPDGIPSDAVMAFEGNPKFQLDSGEFVYGCQTFWCPVDDDE